LLKTRDLRISASSIEAGIRQTIWPARLETIVSRGANWLLDVAHNPAGAWALRAALRTAMRDDNKPVLVFSCLRDKPLTELAQILFPLFDRIVLAPIHSIRANPMEALCETAAQLGVEPMVASSVKHALEAAAQLANGETIVVSGSVYLVGEARSILLSGEEGAQ
jgi:dihydrofolate synthase/folylpolyglutamate synthase